MRSRFKNKQGFTVVELIVVIAVIAILATISIVVYSNMQAEARDARRIQDIANIQKAIELYLMKNRTLPPRSASAASWATSIANPGDYISGISGSGANMTSLPVDPKNSGGMYYRYYVYGAGDGGCDVNRGRFYVLTVMDMESSDRPHPQSPGWKCSVRDWGTEGDYVVGGYTY